MAHASTIFYAGKTKKITATGRKTTTPNGHPAGDQGVIDKSPGAGSKVGGNH